MGAFLLTIAFRSKANAMMPLNWMFGISEVTLIPVGTLNIMNWYSTACFSLAVILLFIYIGIYCFWAVKSPDRLQIEKYKVPF